MRVLGLLDFPPLGYWFLQLLDCLAVHSSWISAAAVQFCVFVCGASLPGSAHPLDSGATAAEGVTTSHST